MIVLFTKDAKISDEAKALMIEKGYVPVEVETLDAVKVLEIPSVVAAGDMDVITAAAIDAINSFLPGAAVHGAFGNALAKRLSKRGAA